MLEKSLKNTRDELYKVATLHSALPKNNYFKGIFHGFCLPSRNSFSKEHFSVAASQLFIIHRKTDVQVPHCRLQFRVRIELALAGARFS